MKINAKLLPSYTTTEQRVGTWLGKPLYRIVVNTTTPSQAATWGTVYSGNQKIKEVVNFGGYVSENAVKWILPITRTNNLLTWFVIRNNEIQMAVGDSGLTNKNIIAWFEYTKTTD